jgi:hypothetical protein
VAQSLALMADGTLWRWLATSAEIAEPVTAASVDGDLRAQVQAVPLNELAEEYVVDCPGAPVEQIYLNPAGVEVTGTEESLPESVESIEVVVACPSFSLPTTLLTLYGRLDDLLAESDSEAGIPAPPLAIPLETLLAYERMDGARLLLLQRGQARALSPGGDVYTSTLGLSEVISVTTALRETGALQSGVEAYAEDLSPNSLLVRGPAGMMEAVWAEEPPEPLQEGVGRLDALLEESIGIEPEGTGTPNATGTVTTTVTATAAATATPSP